MAVVLANRRLGVRAQQAGGRGAHGERLAGGHGPVRGPWPGRAEEGADVPAGRLEGRVWELGMDPAAWPLFPDDLVVDLDSGQEWLVTSADLRTNNATPIVDYVQVSAHLRTGGHTRP